MIIQNIANIIKKMPLEWKSIQNIKWNQDGLINEIKQYLKTDTMSSRIEDTYIKKWRWKRLYDNFTYNSDDDHIYLVIENEADLPPYFKDDNGNVLIDVDLPFKLRVIETEQERNEIMDTYYRNLFGNGYRSALNFYQRLSKEFLNVSRSQVQQFLKNIEIKQLTHPIEKIK